MDTRKSLAAEAGVGPDEVASEVLAFGLSVMACNAETLTMLELTGKARRAQRESKGETTH